MDEINKAYFMRDDDIIVSHTDAMMDAVWIFLVIG